MDELPIRAQDGELLAWGAPESVGAFANRIAGETAHSRYRSTKAQNTLRRQKADLKLFFRFLESVHYEQPIAHFLDSGDWSLWSGVTHGLVEAFVEWQARCGYSIGSINVRLATIKTYCNLVVKAGKLSRQEYASIKLVKGYSHKEGVHLDKRRPLTRLGEKKQQATSLTPHHALLLKRQPDTVLGRRDAAMMCLLLDHGLRCGELAGLRVEHLNLAQGTLTFYREKVDMVQTHRLTPESLVALMRYLPQVQGPYLFAGPKGRAMSTRAINKRVGHLGRIIQLEHLSPHDCRHYWATVAMRNGTDIKALQVAGGWKSAQMPLRYAEASALANEGVKLGASQAASVVSPDASLCPDGNSLNS